MLGVQVKQTDFEATVMMGAQSGGVTNLRVKDPNGNVVVNETLAPKRRLLRQKATSGSAHSRSP